MAKRRKPKSQRARRGPKSPFEIPLDELLDRLFDSFLQQTQFGGSENINGQQPTPPLTAPEHELYAEIVELGFREAIKRYHPDREGGSTEKAAAINALRDKVRRLAGVER